MHTEPKLFFEKKPGKPARIAIFLSGSGTNAEKVLDLWKNLGEKAEFEPVCLVTERPKTSRTLELSKKYNVPAVCVGLKDFYTKHGLQTTSLATEEGRKVRELWTDQLRKEIEPYKIDFAVFAGFVPLCNITSDYPCLNVHPGDLTYEVDGQRKLVGLHTIPIKEAFLHGLDYMRSSVIIASAFSDGGDGMDEGLILGVSQAVSTDLKGMILEDIQGELKKSPLSKTMKTLLDDNQEKLKIHGDWQVLPSVVQDFSAGKMAEDANGSLLIKVNKKWVPVEYIVYKDSNKEVVFSANPD